MIKSRSFVAAALALVSFAAQAGGGVDAHPFTIDTTSTLSREAVRSQPRAAEVGDASTAFVVAHGSTRSRAQVAAELAEAQRLGLTFRSEGDALIATRDQQLQIERAGNEAAMMAARAVKAG